MKIKWQHLSKLLIPPSISKRQLIIVLFSLVYSGMGLCQPATIENSRYTVNKDTTGSSAENNNKLSGKSFFDTYGIDPTKNFYGKLLSESIIRIAPSCSSEIHEISLPAGEVLRIYKYLSNEDGGCWAVRYEGYYGFIKGDRIMPVKDKASAERKAEEYDTPPELITIIRPKYPKQARKEHIKGSVIVKAYIKKNGLVEDVRITKGIDGLNQSAAEAVKKAWFKPATYNGKKISTWISLSIDFE
jgi:TonB family protein